MECNGQSWGSHATVWVEVGKGRWNIERHHGHLSTDSLLRSTSGHEMGSKLTIMCG